MDYRSRALTRHLPREQAVAISPDPLSIQEVRQQFPNGLKVENIVGGYALIRHYDAVQYFIADFRNFLGSSATLSSLGHNRFHIQQMRFREKRLKKLILQKVYIENPS